MKILKKLWSNRPFRTFIQGFAVVFFGSPLLQIKDVNMLKTLILSAIMAGISAVMSLSTGEEKFVRTNTEETVPEFEIEEISETGEE